MRFTVFNRSQIKQMVTKQRALCNCAQCMLTYECNIYDAAKSCTGHLCSTCKSQITALKTFSQADLLTVLDYDEATGVLTFRYDSVSGLRSERAGYRHSQGYFSISIGREEYLVHRVIWFMQTGVWPIQIDHKNHDRSDNRWSNLRDVRSRENQLNMGIRKNNSTGVQGVRQLPSGKFHAYIMVNRKQIALGSYEHLLDAASARKNAEALYGFHINHGS